MDEHNECVGKCDADDQSKTCCEYGCFYGKMLKGNEINKEIVLQMFDYPNDTEYSGKWTPVLEKSLETCMDLSELCSKVQLSLN